MNNTKKKRKKICLISSSGGHYEQLKMLSPLAVENDVFWVTEKVDYTQQADYYLIQTGTKDKLFPIKMVLNFIYSIRFWYLERPDFVITTGTLVALPMVLFAKFFKKKVIYIESFARVYDGSRFGRFMYKHADLFIIQWESLKKIYPDAIYGGSIY